MSPPSKQQIQAAAASRLQSVSSALDKSAAPFKNPNHLKFSAGQPAGMPVWWSPLNPVQFLLRSAYIRPHRIALKHPAIGVEWTYAEW
jgi:hypothetical protein